ncbi:MAG: divisome protein SepX/GlpR [Stackebrandtia sp.]
MPTSVLLAVLVGAGLLALAPALVRRYDADERIAADRESSQAKVLKRERRSRTVPGTAPINPPRRSEPAADPDADDEPLPHADVPGAKSSPADSTTRGWERSGARRAGSVPLRQDPAAPRRKEVPVAASAEMRAWWRQRHRRVLYVLLALNLAELACVIFIGPGFWLGVAVSLALLGAFLRFLRMRALREMEERAIEAEARARPALTGRRVYVPAQSDGEAETSDHAEESDADHETEHSAAVDESAPPDESGARGFVPGFDDEEPEAAEPPPSRRRTGGIRGRSYESPANL